MDYQRSFGSPLRFHSEIETGEKGIIEAVKYGHLDIVKYIMEKLIEIYRLPVYILGYLPLRSAAISGQLDIVKYFMEMRGINEVPKDSKENRDLLFHARLKEESLYSTGRWVDSFMGRGVSWEPIHYAAFCGKMEIVKYLMEVASGIEKEPRTHYALEDTPIHFASLEGHLDIVKYLMDTITEKEPKNKFGRMPIHYAAWNGRKEILKYFMEEATGIEKEPEDSAGLRPIHWAVKNGNLEIVKYLMGTITEKEPKTHRNLTPIHYAAKEDNVEILKYFMEEVNGIEKEPKDIHNQRPIHLAAESGDLKSVKYLMNKIIEKEPRDSSGRTPIHLAARSGNVKLLRYFMEEVNGIEKEPKNYYNERPIHYAALTGLKDPGNPINRTTLPNKQIGHLGSVKYLMTKIIEKEPRDGNGRKPIHVAAFWGNVGILEYFMENVTGIEKEPIENYENRPIHFAAEQGHLHCVEYLMSKITEKEPVNKFGQTPLDLAINCHGINKTFFSGELHDCQQVVKFLEGGEPLYYDHQGVPCIDHCIDN